MKYLATYFLSAAILISASTSVQDVRSIFGPNSCIQGSLSTLTSKTTETLALREGESTSTSSTLDQYFKNVSNTKHSEKNVLSKLNELAQYNEIDYVFKLIKEEGPAHNKFFTISLTLGNEEYAGEGSSLKKAQQNAALVALAKTEYEAPLLQDEDERIDTTTPTVLLNNLAAKLGIGVEYFLVNNNRSQKKSYLKKLNESMYSDIAIRKEESQMTGPFNVAVEVGDEFFYGKSHTIQSARHEAASKAIDHLVRVVRYGDSVCLQEGSEEECKQAKAKLKSPVSQVYEAAQLRNLDVGFEIIEESGPPHKRVFVTQCKLGYLSTTGSGSSKKESKRAAAESMLEHINELPEVSQEMYVKNIVKDNKKRKNKKKKKIIKTNFDVINMHVDNLISSVKNYGSPSKNDGETIVGVDSKNKKRKFSSKSYQDGMLELGNLLDFEIDFTDFEEAEQFYALMSLHVDPEHICLGEGPSSKIARNKAAKAGLSLLQNINLENHFKNRKLTLVETEVKQKIRVLLDAGVSEVQTE
ncbi:hypothetical protein NQ315_007674 [Exocentrus adspersus]|uniref:DRBM domain-containing protein n=1 Tax=Exocentrus adspersus TaxID=1586481 RepID=A0AAV8W917_9CUCU|nr:hypothetical protein NQ315_007674 [Exocentrus adspersus]